jgi:hypothetical protein
MIPGKFCLAQTSQNPAGTRWGRKPADCRLWPLLPHFLLREPPVNASGVAVATQSQTNKQTRTAMAKERDLPVLTCTPSEFPKIFVGVSRTRLYQAIRTGEIKTIKDRKRRIIEIEEGRRWVRSLAGDTEQDSAA